MEFAANWMIFGAFLLMQLGVLGALGGDDDEADTPLDEDRIPDYDPGDYPSEHHGTDSDETFTPAAGESGLAWFGHGGHDVATGTAGDDYFDGGVGNDTINGEDGNDIIAGGTGDDVLQASHGDDTVYGQSGNDFIDGSLGDDVIAGGSGDDTLAGAGGSDVIHGGSGNDVLSSDRLDGADRFDRGADSLFGGGGDDRLYLAQGDTGTGGAGADTFGVIESDTQAAESALITDFDPAHEVLQIYHNPVAAGDPDPVASVSYDAAADVTRIALNGSEVARLTGQIDLQPGDIQLIDQTRFGRR